MKGNSAANNSLSLFRKTKNSTNCEQTTGQSPFVTVSLSHEVPEVLTEEVSPEKHQKHEETIFWGYKSFFLSQVANLRDSHGFSEQDVQ